LVSAVVPLELLTSSGVPEANLGDLFGENRAHNTSSKPVIKTG
jgi:hypothetical protein